MNRLYTLFRILLVAALFATIGATVAVAQINYPIQLQDVPPQTPINDINEINNSIPNSVNTVGGFSDRLNNCIQIPPSGIGLAEWRDKKSARFTFCMRQILGEGTEYTLARLSDYMRPAMYAIIFLATIVMGMKAIGGMFRNTKAETTKFITYVALVIIAFENMDSIAELLYDTTDILLVMLGDGAAATFIATGGGGFQCKAALTATTYTDYEWIKIFDWLDCLFGKLFGLASSSGAKATFVGIAGASVFAGTTGAHAGMVFLGFIITLAMFLLRITTMMVMAYGALSMVMLMLPIFLLTVFFKVTESYFFQRWVLIVVRTMVQPAVAIGFLYFAVAALDILIYKGSEGYFYSYEHQTSNTDPYGVSSKIKTEEVVPGNLPSQLGSDYGQVIEPIYGIIDIDPAVDSVEAQSAKIQTLVTKEKLFKDKITLDADSGFYKFTSAQCGDAGIWDASTGQALSWVNAKAAEVKQFLGKYSPDPNKTYEKVQEGLQAPVGSDFRRWAVGIACSTGRLIANVGFLREPLENKVNSMVPTVPTLDLGSLAVGSEDPNKVHEEKVGKLSVALFALLVLGGTLYSFSNYIEVMARSLFGRAGMGLSIMSSSGMGGSLAGKVKTGFGAVENTWKKAVDKKGAGNDKK